MLSFADIVSLRLSPFLLFCFIKSLKKQLTLTLGLFQSGVWASFDLFGLLNLRNAVGSVFRVQDDVVVHVFIGVRKEMPVVIALLAFLVALAN